MDLVRVTPAEVIPAQQVNQERELLQVVMRAAQDPDIDPARLREFLTIGRELEADQARKHYNRAWAEMAPALPEITQRGLIQYKPGAKGTQYAKWDDIHRACMPILQKFGFAVSFDSITAASSITVIVIITHAAGHEERRAFTVPASDSGGSKSPAQAAASSFTLAQRHAFCKAFNILTIGQDDDGTGQANGPRISEEMARKLEDMLTAGEDKEPGMRARFLKWVKAELLADRISDLYVSQLPRVQAVLAPKAAK